MTIVLTEDFDALDGSRKQSDRAPGPVIPAGRHAAIRIPNPYGANKEPWIVLEGTKTGASESFLRRSPEVRIEG